MNMPLYQNDPRLSVVTSLAPYGCLVSTLRQVVERKVGRALSVDQWIEMYGWLTQNGRVRDDETLQAYVLDHEAVLKAAQYYLRVPQNAKYVFREGNGDGQDFRHQGPVNAWICHGRIAGSGIAHFWEIFENGDCAWDPLWPTRPKLTTISVRGYWVGGA
jgi:hypothetical protein